MTLDCVVLRLAIHYTRDRAGWPISLDQAIRVVNNPARIEVQGDGLTRFWGFVPELRH